MMFGVTKGFAPLWMDMAISFHMLLLCLFRGQTVCRNLNAGLLIHRQDCSCVRHSNCASHWHFLLHAQCDQPPTDEGHTMCVSLFLRDCAHSKYQTTSPPLWWKSLLIPKELQAHLCWIPSQTSMLRRARRADLIGNWSQNLCPSHSRRPIRSADIKMSQHPELFPKPVKKKGE